MRAAQSLAAHCRTRKPQPKIAHLTMPDEATHRRAEGIGNEQRIIIGIIHSSLSPLIKQRKNSHRSSPPNTTDSPSTPPSRLERTATKGSSESNGITRTSSSHTASSPGLKISPGYRSNASHGFSQSAKQALGSSEPCSKPDPTPPHPLQRPKKNQSRN
ncbi:MAG: hypothetical protein M2R45_04547 [Verrucomicrobia subdivision 3 bacterium]|nr:hypothetical protein [Limisphaerales bacterium]MCS1416814.1 hypothetical protein [Limisphaerales bacterium]